MVWTICSSNKVGQDGANDVTLRTLIDRIAKAIGPPALALVVLIIVALPLFYRGYGIHNDYFINVYQGCCFPETEFLFLIGRPLGAILLNVEFYPLTGVSTLRCARVFGLGLLFLVFLLTWRKLLSLDPSQKIFAWMAALLVVLLPGFLLNAIWVANHVPGLVGSLFAIWSYYVVDACKPGERLKLAQGYGLLCLSFLIYPPSAYYFLVFTVWKALSGRYAWKAVALENAALVALSLAYLIFARYVLLPLAEFLMPEESLRVLSYSNYSLDLASSTAGKGQRLKDLTHLTLGTWGADIFRHSWRFVLLTVLLGIIFRQGVRGARPSLYWALGAFALILFTLSDPRHFAARFNVAVLVCLAVILYNCFTKRPDARHYASAAAILAALFISMAPIVVSEAGFVAYRNSVSTAAIAAVAFAWALSGLADRRPAFVLGLCAAAIAGLLGHQRLKWTALNAVTEYRFLQEEVSRYRPEDGAIVIKQPPMGSLIYPLYVYRDFGFYLTNINDVSGGAMAGLLRERALVESGISSQSDLGPSPIDSSPILALHRWIYPKWFSGPRLSDSPDATEAPALPVFWAYRAEDGLEIDNASNYVIDMTRAGFTSAMPDDRKTTLRAISAKLPAKAEHAVIGVSPPSVVAPTKLFQYDTPEVWESSPGFPVDLSVRFDQCRHIAGYEFVSFRQKDLAYFPKKWIARFSNDKSSVSSSDALEIDQLVEETILKDEWKLRRPLAERGCYSVANFRFLEGFDPRALRIAKIRFHD